jgi:hypothetical protein
MSIKYSCEIQRLVSEQTLKQGRKRPLYTPKRMIERRERERKVQGEN